MNSVAQTVPIAFAWHLRRQEPIVARTCPATIMREFLDTYGALILRLSKSCVGRRKDGLDASDVAQEVIASLLQMHRQGSFDPAQLEHPEAYLRVVVRNAHQHASRRTQRAGELTSEGDVEGLSALFSTPRPDVATPEQLTREALDARRTLEAIKQRLRPRDATAFALLVEDGLSIEETAAALGTTVNNVYQMRHRVLLVVRELSAGDESAAAGAGEHS